MKNSKLATLLCGCALAPLMSNAAKHNPNIVIVVADDLGWGDVGFHGSEIKTPCLDSLAREGVELERFYTSPISSPTRAGLMTGRYPNRFGFRDAVIPPWREDGLDAGEETIADMLGRNGYTNRAIIGKWHLGHTREEHYPLHRGFTHFYGHLNGAINYFDHTREGELDWHNDYETCRDQGYSTDLITAEAVRCIDKYSAQDSPFLLYVAYNAPHTPLQAKEEDIRIYAPDTTGLKPRQIRKATYSAMVTCMDRGIGTIVDELRAKGILDDTIVLFFSDNGCASTPGSSSGPLRGHKFDEWDGGVRAPAILLWSKARKHYPALRRQLTGFVDVAPTLRDLVGDTTAPVRPYDGISILPVLKGKATGIPRQMYLGHGAVVTDGYKFISRGKQPGLNLERDFLTDIVADPYEKQNMAPAHPELTDSLRRIVQRFDTITPYTPELPYGHGQKGFRAPAEWKITRR